MPNMINVIDAAKEIRFGMVDRPDDDVPKNYVEAMDRLIRIAELAKDYADKAGTTDSPIAKLLQPFEDKYATQSQGGTDGN